MGGVGPYEVLVIAVIIFILFGGKLMQRFFKSLGEAIKETKKLKKELEKEN